MCRKGFHPLKSHSIWQRITVFRQGIANIPFPIDRSQHRFIAGANPSSFQGAGRDRKGLFVRVSNLQQESLGILVADGIGQFDLDFINTFGRFRNRLLQEVLSGQSSALDGAVVQDEALWQSAHFPGIGLDAPVRRQRKAIEFAGNGIFEDSVAICAVLEMASNL